MKKTIIGFLLGALSIMYLLALGLFVLSGVSFLYYKNSDAGLVFASSGIVLLAGLVLIVLSYRFRKTMGETLLQGIFEGLFQMLFRILP